MIWLSTLWLAGCGLLSSSDPAQSRIQALERALDTLDTGGTATLEGGITITTTISGGVRTTTWDHGDVSPYTVVDDGQGTVTSTSDDNDDGMIDYTSVVTTTDTTKTVVITTDEDFDGTEDHRETQVHQNDGTVTTTLEELQNNAFVVVSTSTRPDVETDCAKDEASQLGAEMESLYPTFGGKDIPTDFDHIFISENGCDEPQQMRIKSMLKNKLLDELSCLKSYNRKVADKLYQAIHKDKITIACTGNVPIQPDGCQILGVTFPAELLLETYINLNPSRLQGVALADTLFHELIHAAGYGHAKDDPTGGAGSDTIYSCAQYCSKHDCGSLGTDGSQSSALDCARCATGNKKAQCGQKIMRVQDGACDGNPGDCISGSSDVPCQTCGRALSVYCDGTPITGVSSAVCCSDCAGTTNYSCDHAFDKSACTDPPPNCR
jgi:hypothetical protein